MDQGGKEYDVELIELHKDYDQSLRVNDIAIIKTKEPFDMQYADILQLYREELLEGDPLLLSGFGAKEVCFYSFHSISFCLQLSHNKLLDTKYLGEFEKSLKTLYRMIFKSVSLSRHDTHPTQ